MRISVGTAAGHPRTRRKYSIWLRAASHQTRALNIATVAVLALVVFSVTIGTTAWQTQNAVRIRQFLGTRPVHHGKAINTAGRTLTLDTTGQLNSERFAETSKGNTLPENVAQLAIGRLPDVSDQGIPADFSWQTYLSYHPELRGYGITTQLQCEEHYIRQGRSEGRIYKRLDLTLRYSVCHGFINQHYSHIAAFSLARMLGAEIVLPTGCKRDSFGSAFSTDKAKNNVIWKTTPLESILDVNRIISYWFNKGFVVHRTPPVTFGQIIDQPGEQLYPKYRQPDSEADTIVRMDGVYFKNYDMSELVEKARLTVVTAAAALLRADPSRDLSRMTLDLPCAFFSLRTLSTLPLVTEVAGSLKFAPALHAMAQKVLGDIRVEHHVFNAVHLRVEKDAEDWIKILGGPEKTWSLYLDAMRKGNFDPQTPIYLASGLLTYGSNQDDMQRIVGLLVQAGVASTVLYKERYLDQPDLDALTSEQKALLDFLVLAEGKTFVGLGVSTFAYFLREHRALHGMPKSATVFVDSSAVGTDPLFFSAATVI